jgi:hypothetical protein
MNPKFEKYLKISIPFIILAVILINNRPCDKQCIKDKISNHKARRTYFWKPFLKKPLLERVGPAPKSLVRLINLDNKLNDYPIGTKPAELSVEFKKDLDTAVTALPTRLKKYMEKYLTGIFIADNLGGTGYSDIVLDNGTPYAAYIVLDPKMLNSKANQWLTMKENSPFKQSGEYRIQGVLEPESTNTRVNALTFIFLHELGHVVGAIEKAHQAWWTSEDGSKFDFFNISWHYDKSKRVMPKKAHEFSGRDRVKFYFGASLENSEIVDIYKGLEKTNFPTLYSATGVFDDFADSFASYVHMKIFKKPYFINVLKKDTIAFSYKPCWGELRCKEKEIVLDKIYESLNQRG